MREFQTLHPGMPRQGGAALIMGLLVLVIMALLSITATNSTLMQNRMAGNFRDSSVAFQASEGGSRWAMAWLLSLDETERPFPCASSCTSGSPVWSPGQYPLEPASSETFWVAANGYGIDPTDGNAVSPARRAENKMSLAIAGPTRSVRTLTAR